METVSIPAEPAPSITWRQVAAVALGNGLKFYDFLVFAFFAIQIGHAFFPPASGDGNLLASLATFGAGFVTRPLGALVVGSLADRIGRKPVMLGSFGLIALGSIGTALVPGYAAIGIAAPVIVIVLRLLQGFALGGEVGASTAFLIEASPPDRRGFYVSLQYVGQNAATLLAGLVGVTLTAILGAAALDAWGWRLAFLLGGAIVPLGLALRRTLPETLHAATAREPVPPLASYARVAVAALLLLTAGTVVTYVMNYMTTYASATLHMPAAAAFGATVAVGICGTLFTPPAGWLSDRIGRRPLMLWPAALLALIAFPAFWFVAAVGTGWSLWLASGVLRIAIAFSQAAILVAVTESLPPRIRAGALATLYAIAISVFGGSTQLTMAWLIQRTGDPLVPAWYLLVAALVGLAAAWLLPESAPVRRPSAPRRSRR